MALLGVGEDAVDVPGRNTAVILGDRLLEDGRSRCTPLPVSAEIFSTGASPMKASRRDSSARSDGAIVRVGQQLPLVEHHDDGASAGVDAFGEALVLTGDALGGVDHEEGDVGVVDRPQGPHQRVVLGGVVDP